MPITNRAEAVAEEYDLIIVGGGSAGCSLAGTLSKAAEEKGLSILLIEYGPDNHNDPNVVLPGRYWSNLRPDSPYFDFIKSKLSHCENREIAVAIPHVLGGGGSLNFMMYTRASASDFDEWRTEGWSAEDLKPLLRKIENYQNPRDPDTDVNVHGFSGPVAVSLGPNGIQPGDPSVNEAHIAAQKLGFPIFPDMQNLKNGHGFSEWPKWIDPVTGLRQDPAHTYIHPNISDDPKTSLTVLCEHKVVRVLIKEGRATGVEILPTTPADTPVLRVIRARSMVVLSAGSFSSPPILERSGIGSPEILRRAGVDCLVDLPGVGENLQDHLGILYTYRFDKNLKNYNDYLNGDPAALLKADEDFKRDRKGAHSVNFIPSAAKVRPTEEEVDEMGPAFRELWNSYYRDATDKPLLIHTSIERPLVGPEFPILAPGYAYKLWNTFTLYPVSRGSAHITSNSVNDHPEFRPQYLSDRRDMPPHVFGYKQQREIARRMPSFRGEVRELSPPFPETSAARIVEFPTPEERVQMASTKIVYTEEDNKIIEAWVLAHFDAVWHWLGTAAMKPREQGGVVDKNLNVYGVKGLKVVDLSICPGNVGANTYSTALLVGVKAADIVGKELELDI